MGRKDPRVDAYIEKSQPFAKPILKYIRKAVHAGCPEVEETLKWSAPHFDYKGVMCGVAAFKEHIRFGFWKSQLLDAGGRGVGEGMTQFGCVRSIDDLPPEKTLVALVRQAARLNDEGVKAPRKRPAPKATLKTPPDFAAALKKNRKAQAAFDAFSPSHKREYVEWITEAKQEATRQRRIATALEWLEAGKPRHWKYMNAER
ncbi:MAG TPA: YdeI/OmpD-associated family protein [Vicinamibacterales bacterium]|nr:YdeI/OmpD-associated family protein [Vicinamibacterales bacterium]